MQVAARIGTMARRGAPLPYDAEVEYLESTGTQWIDTGFKANTTTTSFDCGIMPLNTTTPQGIFGSRNSMNGAVSDAANIFIIGSTFRLDWLSGNVHNTYAIIRGAEYTISITRGSATVNGTDLTSDNRESVQNTYNFLICNFSNGSAKPYTTGFIGRWKWAKLYSNEVLVRDFIPVRVGDVGYMYDRVSGQLFGNSGTGAFTWGELET